MAEREAVITMRVPAAQKEAWQEQAALAKSTLTALIQARMEGTRPAGPAPRKRRMGRKADPLLLAGVGRVGSNLNQIARWANTYKSAAEATEILLALVAVEHAIEKVLLSYRPVVGVAVEPEEGVRHDE